MTSMNRARSYTQDGLCQKRKAKLVLILYIYPISILGPECWLLRGGFRAEIAISYPPYIRPFMMKDECMTSALDSLGYSSYAIRVNSRSFRLGVLCT